MTVEMKNCGFLIIFLAFQVAAKSATKDVNTLNGPVTGTSRDIDGKHVWEFLAVPFAEPPIGSLRFRAPKPLTRTWTEPLQATKPPKGCLQMPMQLELYFPKFLVPTYGEDCLYLNIWTPNDDRQSKKSVMVWIHGGGFLAGESLPLYDGKALAAIGDVLVVVIQYRVGFMGFARFDGELVPGNNGLLDQQLALKWVHENIEAFGGDPESVTIFGESAGSASVAYHLINEESGRYYKRAIMQSGSFGTNGWSFNPNTDALEVLNRKIAYEYLNCEQTDTKDLLQCMEKASEEELTAMITNFTMRAMESGEPIGGPTLDGHFLTRNPSDILKSGDIHQKDVIIGLNEREGSLFVAMMGMMIAQTQNISGTIDVLQMVNHQLIKTTINQFIANYPYYPQKMSPAAKEMIIQHSTSHVDPSRGDYNAIKLAESLGHFLIDCSVNKFADAIRAVHENVYFYEMAHMPSHPFIEVVAGDWMKCTHGDDIPFIFALPLVYPGIRNMTDDELLLARRMIGDWTHFARTGHPLDPNWRHFTLKEKGFYQYKLKSSFETGGTRRDECVFWDNILPMVNGFTCVEDSNSNCILKDITAPNSSEKQNKDEL